MKSEIKGTKAAGEKVEGELLFLGEEEIGISNLGQEIKGKIIVGGRFGRAALMKAQALEVAGVVSSEISDELFEEISQGKTWEWGIDESLSLKLSLLLVEKSSLSLLKDYQGKKVSLFPDEKKIYVA